MPSRPRRRPAPPPAGPILPPGRIVTIAETLDDPALFGAHFRGETWGAWRVFLKALFAESLTDAETEAYRQHTGRVAPPAAPFREAALIVGRRGGKSRVLATIAVFVAVFRDYAPHLAPGEFATVGVLAANRDQARSIFRYILGLLKETELLAPLIADANSEAIELSNRVRIEIATASFRTTRGYSFAAVLCDEIAFWRSDETSANPDVEILRALRPGMASIPGSILLLASSPYAKRGALYDAFRRHYGQDDARVLVWKADTAAMNPGIDPALIAEAYDDDPEAARAEYGAEFRDDLADFVTREVVDAVTMRGRSELPPMPGIAYSAFADPSGGVSDAMTLAIAHIDAAGIVILDAVSEARPPFDPEATVKDFAELLRRYNVTTVTGDRYGGEWPRQRFREHGIDYMPSARPKSDLYMDLLPLLHAGRVELLDHPRITSQLVGLERRTARSGRDSVDHTPGGHDDLVNAVAGALVNLDLDRRPALIRPSALLDEGKRPIALPRRAQLVYATLFFSLDGLAAAAVFVQQHHFQKPTLIVADLMVEPLDGGTLERVCERLARVTGDCPPNCEPWVYAPEAVKRTCDLAGVPCSLIPRPMTDAVDDLALAAAGHIHAGRVRLGEGAHAASAIIPLGGALSFTAGTASTPDPLRLAILAGIALALDPERSWKK